MRCQAQAFGAVSRLSWPHAVAALAVFCLLATPAVAATLPEIRALAAEQQYSQALKQLEAFLEDNPDDVEARLFKGVILTRQGNTDEAIATFDQLSKDKPELPEPFNNLAVLYAAQGRYDDSRKVLLRAIELEPRYDTAHENLGDVYAKLASIAYERAFTLNENNTRARDKADWMARVLDTEPAAAAGEIPSAASATLPVAQAATCYAVNGIENRSAARSVAEWFTARGVGAREQIHSEQAGVFYEVYVPPLQSRAATDAKMRRMREDGFADIMRINSGDLENGISVGAYRQLGNAERRIEVFRAKGYQTKFKPRDKTHTTYLVAIDAGASPELKARFTSTFPAYSLSESPCG
ncbi:MAG: hypothetical protein BMS9Abin01_2792 [Gammaproteobacteria bacterium]|nr:MAG: hypothetical protein BMS9Abin01_2792 [Gammaproteobacteria bacterium]